MEKVLEHDPFDSGLRVFLEPCDDLVDRASTSRRPASFGSLPVMSAIAWRRRCIRLLVLADDALGHQ